MFESLDILRMAQSLATHAATRQQAIARHAQEDAALPEQEGQQHGRKRDHRRRPPFLLMAGRSAPTPGTDFQTRTRS